MGKDQVWLGANQIQDDTHRVVLPENVLRLGIADMEATLFWAYDTEEDAVVISHFQDYFTKSSRFETVGESTVSGQKTVDVPQQVMSEYPGFDHGERLHFVTISNQSGKDRCMVLPVDVAPDRFDDAVDGMFSSESE